MKAVLLHLGSRCFSVLLTWVGGNGVVGSLFSVTVTFSKAITVTGLVAIGTLCSGALVGKLFGLLSSIPLSVKVVDDCSLGEDVSFCSDSSRIVSGFRGVEATVLAVDTAMSVGDGRRITHSFGSADGARDAEVTTGAAMVRR